MTDRVIAHVDLDAFYASVEELDHPEYKGAPLVVGADPQGGRGRGVVTTANYAARAFGIRSAMPISEAWRRCPDARFVFPRFSRYAEKSREVFDVVHERADVVAQAGIDEGYLDLTHQVEDFDAGVALVRDLQREIEQRAHLTASFGVATNKTVAKIATDMQKPRGITVVAPGTEATFLAPLPARKIPGVGPKTDARLQELGIRSCADLVALPARRLEDLFGVWGPRLAELARGIDDAPVAVGWQRKSLGSESTFLEDVDDPEVLERTLHDIAADIAGSLVGEGLRARTFTLKVRVTGFETYTRARTLPTPIADAPTVERVAVQLLRDNPPSRAVRLLGLRATGLVGGVTEQTTLRAWPADVLGEAAAWESAQRRLDASWRPGEG